MTTMQSMTDTLDRFAFCCLIFVTPACGGGGGGAAPAPEPGPMGFEYRAPADLGDTWTIAGAAGQGIDEQALETMMDEVLDGKFDVIDSIAIAKDGKLVLDEPVRTEPDRNDSDVGNTNLALHAQFSVSKSITSLVVGIAIDEGYISDVSALPRSRLRAHQRGCRMAVATWRSTRRTHWS